MKRRVVLILLLLVAGAIVNVAVVIILCGLNPTGLVFGVPASLSIVPGNSQASGWAVAEAQRFGARDLATCTNVAGNDLLLTVQTWDVSDEMHFTSAHGLDLPAWCFARQTPSIVASQQPFTNVEEGARGWPLLCVRYRVQTDLTTPTLNPTSSGIIWAFRGRPVPGTPIWPGFAINVAFFAGVLWGLFISPFTIRRWRRIKAGLCPKCAYPVGTNEVCTECGVAVAIKPQRGASTSAQGNALGIDHAASPKP